MKAELYRVLYDHETDQDDELAVKVNEIIRVTNKDSPDWWLAERVNGSNEFGLVPSNFIEKIAHEENEDQKLAIVTQDYTAQSSDELTLQLNGIITILEQDVAEGWWKGDLNGKIGVFPADHVTLLSGAEPSTHEQKSKNGFKLAAYGVKQGGIGSILAGGFGLKRSSTTAGHRTSIQSNASSAETQTMATPAKPPPIKTQLTTPKSTSSPVKAMVIHDYNPENDGNSKKKSCKIRFKKQMKLKLDEIRLMRGEYVTVIDQIENDGWWKGMNEAGATGIFPSNFAQIVDQEISPPQRPHRTRPATVVKPETTSSPQPPPVPVGTRPTSLLTQRETSNSPPPRPTTLPPRPQAQPVAPPRRLDTTRTNTSHKRIPSIPLISPDLPPLSPVHDQKPTRPIPHPIEAPPRPPATQPKSPTENALHHAMAKPPKINQLAKPGSKPSGAVAESSTIVPPPRSFVATNTSPNASEESEKKESVPPFPKRSMPSVPESPQIIKKTDGSEDNSSLIDLSQVRRLIQAETQELRQTFEAKLEQERQERLQLQAELQELKSILNSS
ncbi:hypothetical protein BD560DRAFT_150396 [Blakeslea trispora]|nr:hypothetical protein BD560DRAFT_150396 [Blakeslea trispora]